MLVLEDDLTALIGGVWDSFLGMSAEPSAPGGGEEGPFYTASVAISGGWDGSVSLVLPEALSRVAAAAMFGMAAADLGSDDVADAVGELANTIGGNIKGMIEEPCALSLPVVAVGTDYSVSVPGAQVIQSVFLRSAGQMFQVVVHGRSR